MTHINFVSHPSIYDTSSSIMNDDLIPSGSIPGFINAGENDSPPKDNHYKAFSIFKRDPVFEEAIINAMKWAKENSLEASEIMYDQIITFSKNKTIVQIQIYGIGVLDETDQRRGPFQLSVAFNLLNRFKQEYHKITVTCQEPKLVQAEKNYLQSKNVKVLETRKFSSKNFLRASSTISNPAFICYMIHGDYRMYDEFLKAHWEPELMSRIIFIGNNPNIFIDPSDLMYHRYSEKLKEFAKLCDSKLLKFEKGSAADVGIGDKTCVYSISKENAEILINKFS